MKTRIYLSIILFVTLLLSSEVHAQIFDQFRRIAPIVPIEPPDKKDLFDIPPPPPTPVISSNSCGYTTLSWNGTPPSSVTWYWQGKNSSRTSTGNRASTYRATSSGTYYIRARHNTSGLWSSSRSVSVSVKAAPSTPSTPSVQNNCGNTKLTRGTPPGGVTWYWQGKNSSGTSTSNSSSTYTATSSGTYYIRARHNTSRCWSSSRSVSVSVKAAPSTPSTPSVQNNCGNTKLTRGTPPGGVTWYWQGKNSSGTSTGNSASTYTATSSGTYYIRARHNTSRCWSSSRSVSVSVKAAPSTPSTPSVQNNCGNTKLTRGTPPSGVTWYWQAQNANGTSTSNSSTTYTAVSDGTYYIRARDNASGCWSSSRSVSVNVKEAPTFPSLPTVQNNCGNSVLTRGVPPSGQTFYWQGTNSSGTSTSNSSSTYTVNSSGTYYIRTRHNTSGCWSSSRAVSVNVKIKPDTPSTPNVENYCGQSNLLDGGPPIGVSHYWQGTNANGTNTSHSAADTYTATVSGTYYIRARHNTSGCWSDTRSVSVTIKNNPETPAAPTVQNLCGNTKLTRATPPDGVTWYWQAQNANGTSTSNSSTTYTAVSDDTYYLRAQDNTSGCWSPSRGTTVTVKRIPLQPSTPTVQNNCGNSVLTRDTPPDDITWYWQGTNSSGTSMSNSSPTYTVNNDGTYYLRGYHNTSGCWGSSQSISVTVNTLPGTPSAPSVENNCGHSILTRGTPPGGITWYWQGMNANGTNTGNIDPTYTATSSGTYYLRAQNDATGCWGNSRAISVNIQPETGEPIETNVGSSLAFDGANDYIAIQSFYNSASIPFLTVEAWIKTDISGLGVNDNWAIVDFDRSEFYNVYITGDNGRVGFSTAGTGIHDMYSTTTVNDGDWHHIAVVYDGKNKRIYIDGELDSEALNTHNGNNLGKNVTRYGIIGDGSEASSYNATRNNIYFKGSISELRVWHTPRTKHQIQLNRYNMVDPASSGLHLYYPLSENSGTGSVQDLTNGVSGVLYNFDVNSAWIQEHPFLFIPEVPTGIEAYNHTDKQIMLNWTEVAGATSYEIQRKVNIIDCYETISTTSGTQFTDASVTSGTTYYYQIRAISEGGGSDFSTEVSIEARDITPDGLTYEPQFNGNIAAIKWASWDGTENPEEKVYSYTYDPMNRITGAYYAEKNTTNNNWENNPGVFNVNDITYDLNGNIRSLARYTHRELLGSDITSTITKIDQLSYTYEPDNPNRLSNVADAGHETMGFRDGHKGTGAEYGYDKNGNMTRDDNKGITEILYNDLNLPQQITFTNGNRIVYTYDAAGIKLKKEVFEGNGTTTTYYHGSLQFVEKEGFDTPEENHARMLDFIMTDEGRAVPGTSVGDYDYEYFLKDHLGNTRAVVTTADNAHTFTADMETENPEGFENVNETRHQDALYNRTPNGSYMSYLNPIENGHAVGPALSLKVQPGDSVKMEAYVQYNGSVSTGNTVEGVASAIAGAFGYAGTAETQYILDVFNGAFAAASLLEGYDDNYPRIYLQYLHFDEHFGLIDYGYQQVGYGTLEGSWEKLSHQQLVTEEGYYYIYVVNESEDNIDAFFDDISVEHIESKVTQVADYYPFGMQIKQTSTDVTNPLANKYLYNGKEIQNETQWYDYGARMYDPQLGRFFTQDRFATKYFSLSPYQYAANDPIRNIDVNGDSINVSNLIIQNGKLSTEGLYVLFNMVSDLSDITGQNFSVNGSGNLVSDGKVNKDKNGNQIGSKSARKYVNGLIGSTRDIKVTNDNSKSTQGGGIGSVNINSDQIDNNIASMQSAGLGELTFGYGMSFLHESMHTATGTFVMNPSATTAIGDPSPTTPNAQGPTVTNVNVFRNELGLPERSHYFWQQTSTTAPKTMRWNQGGKTTTVTQGTMTPAVKQQRRGIINAILNFRLP
jgi:RHS repeat-associated protein